MENAQKGCFASIPINQLNAEALEECPYCFRKSIGIICPSCGTAYQKSLPSKWLHRKWNRTIQIKKVKSNEPIVSCQ
ncbi:MAG: hypothetical protein EG822_18485 [Deltaproteobacteria bacterium]|nr:hypothetical protein [Deltaproteobacteria bacterium]TLN02857.1 MAG: hypothetical protein FDZ73_10320 [bacterium]